MLHWSAISGWVLNYSLKVGFGIKNLLMCFTILPHQEVYLEGITGAAPVSLAWKASGLLLSYIPVFSLFL